MPQFTEHKAFFNTPEKECLSTFVGRFQQGIQGNREPNDANCLTPLSAEAFEAILELAGGRDSFEAWQIMALQKVRRLLHTSRTPWLTL